jgi:UDP-glucose 4-epimerase
MKVFVTGAAGFIGSSLCDRLLAEGHEVVGWDNFSTGREEFIEAANRIPKFCLLRGDNLDRNELTAGMAGCEMVFHLAANADVRFGLNHPERDLEQNTIATFNVLEAMRKNGTKCIAFSSTGSVYGEAEVIPTPENAPFPVQTSLYASSKLACEALIQAYCEGYGFEGYIFRFVSILGERYTHGHVIDFYRQLLKHPGHLDVLGDGSQRKSYLYVQDCISAIIGVAMSGCARQCRHGVEILNLGTDEYCSVRDSIGWICGEMGVDPLLKFSGGERGWVGDNPFIYLDTKKMRSRGWRPSLTIENAVRSTVRWLQANPVIANGVGP